MKFLLPIACIICLNSTSIAQPEQTFIYKLQLFERFQSKSSWTDREHAIQQQHISYLDSLTKVGQLEIAGIGDQGLMEQTGLVILKVDSFEKVQEIISHDPSVHKGMMFANIRPMTIYFKKED